MENKVHKSGKKRISWEMMYPLAEDYYKKNGNLNVPITYMTECGIRLGRWLVKMNMAHNGFGNERITKEQEQMLEKIGMVWKRGTIPQWDTYYDLAKAYYNTNGHLNIATSYITADGIRLGRWINNMRYAYVKNDSELTDDRIKKLVDIGMVFNRETVGRRRVLKRAESGLIIKSRDY